MGQVSSKLRGVQGGYAMYCAACDELHVLPASWTFNGDLERPTFSPSFKISGVANAGVGFKVNPGPMDPTKVVCHFNLTDGVLFYHADSTHAMRGFVALPDLPPGYQDDPIFAEQA